MKTCKRNTHLKNSNSTKMRCSVKKPKRKKVKTSSLRSQNTSRMISLIILPIQPLKKRKTPEAVDTGVAEEEEAAMTSTLIEMTDTEDEVVAEVKEALVAAETASISEKTTRIDASGLIVSRSIQIS